MPMREIRPRTTRHATWVADIGIDELQAGDDPAAWLELGFEVADGGLVRIGPVIVRLDGETTAWTMQAAAVEVRPHPNGAVALDHVVLLTDSRDRTAAALVDAGGE